MGRAMKIAILSDIHGNIDALEEIMNPVMEEIVVLNAL
jgi:predicted phosphodiesterase